MVSNYWVMVNYELERKCVVVCYRELTVDRNSPRRSKENHGTPVSIVSFNVTGGGGGERKPVQITGARQSGRGPRACLC